MTDVDDIVEAFVITYNSQSVSSLVEDEEKLHGFTGRTACLHISGGRFVSINFVWSYVCKSLIFSNESAQLYTSLFTIASDSFRIFLSRSSVGNGSTISKSESNTMFLIIIFMKGSLYYLIYPICCRSSLLSITSKNTK